MSNYPIDSSNEDPVIRRSEMNSHFDERDRRLDEHGANFVEVHSRIESLERKCGAQYSTPHRSLFDYDDDDAL
jgi:hypothetical protein